ncbi:hypothetical protein PPERSA_00162 [Pseudocohnilembus persalinus]|uniref:Uncharacterized protein n=1 Tax=Pseudocohnilembus persalinus TaxID=266149 RepID=A0A0V0QHU3_PSEPJ|nr:hypothetical protein PPERSA_00162 [Pseudocohnilembus persalinus]|eukprot:KRX01789.1 hypothetical protein PPERSA_00162 [Pseudocohnilembus persalinus]
MNNNSFPQIKHQDSKSGEAKEIERLGKPLWIANFIAKMPCVTFWVLFLILAALVEDQEASYEQQEKGNGEMTTYLIYKKKEGDTLLTVKNLEQIQKIEKKITTMRESEWEEMCEINNQEQFCNKFHSISQIVLGEEGFEIEVTQEKIDLFLQKIENNLEFYEQARQLFEEDFSQNNTDVNYARSIYYFGMPFEGFDNYKDKDEKQLQKFKDWNKELYDYIDKGQGNEDMEVWYYNSLGSEDYQERELNNGLLFALFSQYFWG